MASSTVLRGLEDGSIERVAVDTPEPSAFARRHPLVSALHLPRRCAARRATDAGRDAPTGRGGCEDARLDRRARPRRRVACAGRGVAAARERGGSPRSAVVDGLRHGGRRSGLATVARDAPRGGSRRPRWRALACCGRTDRSAKRSCGDGSRRSAPSSRTTRVFSRHSIRSSRARRRWRGAARASAGRGRLVRAAAPRAHSSLHPGPTAQGDRAGVGGRLRCVPRLLAARRRRAPARRAGGRGRGPWPAGRLRGASRGVGGFNPAAARARLQARVARSRHPLGRVRVGPPLGIWRVRRAGHADRLLPAGRAARVAWSGGESAAAGGRLRRTGLLGARDEGRRVSPGTGDAVKAPRLRRSRWASPSSSPAAW